MKMKEQKTVLVVDDDIAVRNFVETLLNKYGYSVIVCEKGKDALNKLNEYEIDVVLADIVMPEISGTELLGKIRETKPEVPVVLMTGYANLDIAVEAINKGVFDFIVKPYKPEQIIHSLEKALHYKRLVEMEKNYKRLLEEFNQEIENLISERTMNLMALTIADKVRNPATVIGYIGKKMLERKDISQDFKENLQCIIQETEKLQNIVSDFHSLLKKKESRFHYDDINDVVESVISNIERNDIKIVKKLSERPLKINMQKNLLKVALYLLIKNSLEATPSGGTISIKTFQDEEDCIIELNDSGPGMPEELVNKIFDPFFTTKRHGFGLGLPLVKQIIKEHLGEINIESKEDYGTTFRISFPLRWTRDIKI